MNKKMKKGMTGVMVVVIIALLAVVVFSAYIMTTGPGLLNREDQPQLTADDVNIEDAQRNLEEKPVSASDDVNTIEMELEATTVGTLDEDFSDLENEASQL